MPRVIVSPGGTDGIFDYNTGATTVSCMLDRAGDVVQRNIIIIDNPEHHVAAVPGEC